MATPPRVRRQRPVLELAAPWRPPAIPEPIIYAIKAFREGKASAGQQQMLWPWLLWELCLLNRSAFHPESDRATVYAASRQDAGRILASAADNPVRPAPNPRGPPPEEPRGAQAPANEQ